MIKQYFVALVAYAICDSIWLTLMANSFYAKHLGFLMAKSPNMIAAVLFYLLYIFALVVLVISPALQKQSLPAAVGMGALFGLCAYATYDLTNQATINNWPVIVTVVDMAWGTFISAAIAGITYFILTKWQ